MPLTDSPLFLPENAFSPDKVAGFGDHMIVRAVIYRAGKHDDKFLLHERPDWSKISPLLRQFHGGKIEKDETPVEALHRELRQELGLTNQVSEFLGMHEFGGWLNYVYLIRRIKAMPISDKSGQLHKKEERAGQKIDTGWFTLDYMLSHPQEFAFNHVQVAREIAIALNSSTRDRY